MKKILASLVFIFLTLLCWAREYTLQELVNQLDQTPQLRSAQALKEETLQRANQSASDLMDFSFGYELMDLTVNSGKLGTDMAAHKFTLTQSLPTSGKLLFASAAADYEKQAAQQTQEQTKRELKKQLLSTYAALITQQELAKNKHALGLLLNQLSETAQKQFYSGKVSLSKLSQLQISAIQNENDELELNKSVQMNLIELQRLSGLDDQDFRVKTSELDFQSTSIDPDYKTLYAAYLQNSPEYKSLNLAVEKQRAQAGLSRAAFLPDTEVMTEYTYQPQGTSTLGIGVTFNLPIFSMPSKLSAAAAENKAVARTQNDLISAENQARSRLQFLTVELQTQKKQLELLQKKALFLSDENVNHMLQEYQVQQTDLETLFSTLSSDYELKNQYTTILGQYYLNLFEVEALCGVKNYLLSGLSDPKEKK